ncbi:MAG: methyltransferase [candidate division Zixibacteria bacterium]|nr:methyltransferase [candidate division Zixibacteria bacterium]MDH3938672.1 methyltransferase [candidate division Zixibacteria bacterium]MDH4033237.1 methyltransferase [candidate division Zixibacteria bacterium]
MSILTLDKLPKQVLAKIDLQTAFLASRCVIAAERLQLFRKLHGKSLTSTEIGRKTGIRQPRREFFLATLISLGLLRKKGNTYSLTPLARKYFVEERSIYWTTLRSEELVDEYQAFLPLEEVLTTGQSYQSILGIKRPSYTEKMKKNPKWAHDFTHMLYYHHQDNAKALAKHLDLSGYRRLLDIGGGSGVMSMALLRKYRSLSATILDFPPVCKAATKIIQKEGLAKRLDTQPGDLNKRLPSGYDVIMFCDIGETDPEVLKRAYRALPKGGKIVVADYFAKEDWSGPLLRFMWQLRSDTPWLITASRAAKLVRSVGFKSVKRRELRADIIMVTGIK